MICAPLFYLATGVAVAAGAAADSSATQNHGWAQWRGPDASGVVQNAKPPTEWSEDRNVRWKVALPGNGLSTPIVWDNQVFIQTAIPVESETDGSDEGDRRRNRGRGPRVETPDSLYRFVVLALDRRNGKELWRRVVNETVPHEGNHHDGSLAPASPLTDGEHVYAYFGSRGLYCLTMNGEPVWQKNLGRMQTRNGFGEGSSPALYGDVLVVNWDHEGDSFIVALDKKTGQQRWRKSRDEPTSWATPYFLSDNGRVEAVVSGSNHLRSYDLATGDVVWQVSGLGTNCIPTPLAGDGLLFAMSGHREPALLAIRYGGAKGDLTGTDAVAWRLDKGTPYVPSPILYDDTLYMTQKNSGILSCYNARTGEPFYTQQRLDDITGIYASLVGADNRVYVVGRNGVTYVLQRGPLYKVLAVNRLEGEFTASPAIVDHELYLRSLTHLYCLAEK